jgi:sugar phosphate isomerase/epimerase
MVPVFGQCLNRRDFLCATSALVVSAAVGGRLWPSLVGIQLYSVRTALQADLSGTLQQLSATGIRHIETAGFYGRTATQFAEELRRAGLVATSMHVPWNQLAADLTQAIADAKTLGVRQIVCPNLAYNRQLSPRELEEVVQTFTAWASLFAGEGFRFSHHPEMLGKWRSKDGYQLDSVILQTPRQVEFQLDVFWAALGRDPIALLRRYPGRFTTTHLKDFRLPVPSSVITNENLGSASLILGEGDIHWAEFFTACRKSCVTEQFLESENKDAMTQLRPSIDFLKKQNLYASETR